MHAKFILPVLIAAPIVVGSATIVAHSADAGSTSVQDNGNVDEGALSNRLAEARKAVERAEMRLQHATRIGEGVEAARAALASASQELQAAEQAAQ